MVTSDVRGHDYRIHSSVQARTEENDRATRFSRKVKPG